MPIKIPFVFILAAALAGCQANTERTNANASDSEAADTPPASSAAVTSPTQTPVSPTPTLEPLPPDAKGVQAAIDVVEEYYAAINARDFRKAYELWSGKGQASRQTFDEFRDGYENTASVEIDTSGEPGNPEGAAGSQYIKMPLRIKARTRDGKEQRYWGEYTLRRSMVDGADADQRAWRIYSAEFKEL